MLTKWASHAKRGFVKPILFMLPISRRNILLSSKKTKAESVNNSLALFHDKCDLAQRSNLEMLTTPSWQAISALQTRKERQNMSVYLSYSSMKQHIFQTMWSFCYSRLWLKTLVMHSGVGPCSKMVMLTSSQSSTAWAGQNPAELETGGTIICSNV